nr:hypothetical protein [Tanacetum cinerariifolium]
MKLVEEGRANAMEVVEWAGMEERWGKNPSAHAEHDDAQDDVIFSDAHSFHFVHHEDIDEDAADQHDAHLGELDCLRTDLQRKMQANDGLSKKFALLDNAHSMCSERENELTDKLKDMEKERDDWRKTASEHAEKI